MTVRCSLAKTGVIHLRVAAVGLEMLTTATQFTHTDMLKV